MRTLLQNTPPGLLVLTALLLTFSCDQKLGEISGDQLFTLMPESYTGAGFINHLDYDEQLKKKFNIYTYRNFYNGGRVALGDVNNDGKVDLADVSFLLKYLFAGGPPPQPPEADC